MSFVFCHKCKKVTEWRLMRRGSTREQCVGCKDVFPCRKACDHIDCEEHREQKKPAASVPTFQEEQCASRTP